MSELDDLRAMIRSLLAERASSEKVRAAAQTPRGHDAELWSAMAELDLLGLLVPEEYGGSGAGLVEMAVLLHELGRRAVPLPVISSAVLAPTALLAGSNVALAADLLPGLATGQRRAAVVIGGAEGQLSPRAWSLTWAPNGDDVTLNGEAGFVLDAGGADALIVLACNDFGIVIAAVDSSQASVVETPTADFTRRLGRVVFDDVIVPPERIVATADAAARVLARLQHVGAWAVACDSAGLAERTTEQTAEYARQREQFGRPIGSFQAIKHKCANMAIAVECSRAAVSLGLQSLVDESLDADAVAAAVSTAKAYAGDAAVTVCADAMQVHGGIGFTWEHDAHIWLKRAQLNRALFGSSAWHRRRIADAVLPKPVE